MTQEHTNDSSAPSLFDQLRSDPHVQSEPMTNGATETCQHIARQKALETSLPEAQEQEEPNRGRLPPEARRALVNLLREGVVMADSKRVLFEALCRYETSIQDYLADIYFRLLIDHKAGLALLLQQEVTGDADDDDDITSLIRPRPLSLYDTLLLLVLRKHYQQQEAAGAQRVFIDIDRIEAQLTPFLPLTNSSRTDRRQLNAPLNKMKEHRVLATVRGDEERFEITPVIRYVVNAAFLEEMLRAYQNLVAQAGLSEYEGSQDD